MRTNLKRGKLIPPKSKEEAVDRIKQLRHEIEKITEQLGDTSRIVDRMRHPTQDHYEDWAEKADSRRREFRRELRLMETWLAGWNAHEKAGAELIKGALDLFRTLREEDDLLDDELVFAEKFEAFFQPNQPCPRCRAVDAGRKSGLCVTCSGIGQ